MRYNIWLGSLLFLFLISMGCDDASESNYPLTGHPRDIWRDAGMRRPEPVIVDSPKPLKKGTLPDSTFLIQLTADSIFCDYLKNHIYIANMNQLDSVIRSTGISETKTRIALQADHRDAKRVDAVIDILKENDIFRFNLITDLEEQPPHDSEIK